MTTPRNRAADAAAKAGGSKGGSVRPDVTDDPFFRDDADWYIFAETPRRFLLTAAGRATIPILPDDFAVGAPVIARQLEALARLLRAAAAMVEPEVKVN